MTPMDRRIGYGLTKAKAVELALKEIGDKVIRINLGTAKHEVVRAELRDDGWRVYSNCDSKEGRQN